MARAFPATGSKKSMGRIRKGFSGSLPAAGAYIHLRANLGNSLGITTGAVSISSTFGGHYAPHDTTDSDNRS